MKQGRWIGVLLVILAAIGAGWWVMAPEPVPVKKPVATAPKPKAKKSAEPVATDMPEVSPDEPKPSPEKERPAGSAPDDDPEVEPGDYNPSMLPPPATSYQDDPKRFGRTYQAHATLAADAWSKLADSVDDPQLKSEIEEVARDLRDPAADPLETTHAEILLDNKLRNSTELDPKAQSTLDYLNQMSSSVIQDGDPKAIPPPR